MAGTQRSATETARTDALPGETPAWRHVPSWFVFGVGGEGRSSANSSGQVQPVGVRPIVPGTGSLSRVVIASRRRPPPVRRGPVGQTVGLDDELPDGVLAVTASPSTVESAPRRLLPPRMLVTSITTTGTTTSHLAAAMENCVTRRRQRTG